MFVKVAIEVIKMSQFDAEKFMSEPCEDTFYDYKKDELILLAKRLKLEVKKAMRKHQFQNIIVKLKTSFFLTSSIARQKYHNNLFRWSELA